MSMRVCELEKQPSPFLPASVSCVSFPLTEDFSSDTLLTKCAGTSPHQAGLHTIWVSTVRF